MENWWDNITGKTTAPSGGLSGSLYTPSQEEFQGIANSYNTLGGVKGTGMDFDTWQNSMGIGKVGSSDNSGMLDWLGTDTAKNAIGVGGLALSGLGVLNTYNAGKQAKKQWEAENARANEIMAMNREKYNTYKADKAKLNAGYSGLAASGDK